MYQELNPAKTQQLSLLRDGWWNPQYRLTDGTNNFGVLNYSGISKRNPKMETAACKLQFKFEDFFGRTILLQDDKGAIIGECTRELFSRTIVLTLRTGFSAQFYRPAFFSREYVWESAGYGKVMGITNNFPFTLSTDIVLYPTKTPAAVIPALIFLGAHLIILKRRKRAVH